jgi:hypothetical protein
MRSFPVLPFSRALSNPRAAFAAIVLVCAAHSGMGAAQPGWTDLLDRDLTKWRTYLGYAHKNGYDGTQPVDTDGKPVQPIGYDRDERQVFSTRQENGNVVLRISGEIYGCLFTKEEFQNYRLKLKVKWGAAKWEPRQEKLKDSGILYHSVGEAGVDFWRAWMLSQEFQIMEGHMGDYWNIANSAIDIRAFLPEGSMNSVASDRQPFLPFGAKPSVSGFCLRSYDYETPGDGWTELELVCFQDKALHIVNGKVVMILKNSRFMEAGEAKPLTKGRIQLQSEAAEVFFKDVQIQPIDALPTQYDKLFD